MDRAVGLTEDRRRLLDHLTLSMLTYYSGDPKRAQHFLKVHSLARLIAVREELDPETRFTLEAAALVHDIGIRAAEEALGHCDGKLQEAYGPAPAAAMLRALDVPEDVIRRVCFLVAHHHTYQGVEEAPDYRILLEADFLVNLYEDAAAAGLAMEKAASDGPAAKQMRQKACAARDKVFRTDTGRLLLSQMFGI